MVSEDNPTYSNLIGRVEHIAQLDALRQAFGKPPEEQKKNRAK